MQALVQGMRPGDGRAWWRCASVLVLAAAAFFLGPWLIGSPAAANERGPSHGEGAPASTRTAATEAQAVATNDPRPAPDSIGSSAHSEKDGRPPAGEGRREAPASVPGGVSPRLGPPVLIGPSRVTLATGNTIDAISVIRNKGRVKVILEDDTEIDFDQSKVVSVEALADIAPKPRRKAIRMDKMRGPYGIALGSPPVADPGQKASKRGNAARDVQGTQAAQAAHTDQNARVAPSAPATDTMPKTSGAGGGAEGNQGDTDAATALAIELDKAIREADIEDARVKAGKSPKRPAGAGSGRQQGSKTGEEDDAPAESPDGSGAPPGPGAEGAPGDEGERAGEGETSPGEQDAASGEKKLEPLEPPAPEEFDATRPVVRPGYHYIGPRRASDPKEPPVDFPKPAPPVVSLGASIWKPHDGFSFRTKWSSPLAAATSFPNGLSGLDPPITRLGPTFWTPKPVIWQKSIFPESWQPADGFAKPKPTEKK